MQQARALNKCEIRIMQMMYDRRADGLPDFDGNSQVDTLNRLLERGLVSPLGDGTYYLSDGGLVALLGFYRDTYNLGTGDEKLFWDSGNRVWVVRPVGGLWEVEHVEGPSEG
ncbi:hypothetical protein [Ferrimonas marina]|uniref:Uncharacterized protein n=1 Tax=Ferrimonas marina TaxID=299255 RepID=A0A1M5U5W9_9GAMM|nr:hypothetical protein [Ferrimonas marina]SHH58364.1 hypothetical protein SAMN02745129_2421 [Ferrimonas marina]